MKLSEIKKAMKNSVPVTLKENVIQERENVFGFKGLFHRNIEKNIGKKLYVHSIEKDFVRLNGMEISEKSGKSINSYEVIIPFTSLKLYK